MKFSNLLHSMSKSNILQKEDVITNGKRGRVCFPKTRATGYMSYQAQIRHLCGQRSFYTYTLSTYCCSHTPNSRVLASFPRQIPSDQQPLYTREGQTMIHRPGLADCLFFIKFYWKAAMPSHTHMIYGCFCTVGAKINGSDRSSIACEAGSIIYSLVIHRKGLLTLQG